MTLGIAIPAHYKHICHLQKLLETLSESTILPDEVSISISSFDGIIELKEFPFKLIVNKTPAAKNACENRNIAANNLNTDIISFFDADDLPNIKRNEFILKSFDMGANAVLHDYYVSDDRNSKLCYLISEMNYMHNYVDTIFENLSFPKSQIKHEDYACGHVSVRREIFDKIKYNEEIGWSPGEDGEYLKRLVYNNFPISYLHNKLSLYIH